MGYNKIIKDKKKTTTDKERDKMFRDNRFINAGQNEIYRYGHRAVEKVSEFLEPNKNGYYTFPTHGGRYWTMGTSEGKYGEFMKFGDTIFSVNKGGYAYAKAGTDKGEKFVNFLNAIIAEMHRLNKERIDYLTRNDVEEEEE